MTHIMRVDAGKLIEKAADALKTEGSVEATEWAQFVKTGHHKERLPDNPDWWFVRSAAILRSVAATGPIGTQKLRHKFGGKKNRGHKPGHFYKASGSIIRKILQQLEKSGLISQTQKGSFKGRILTPKGTSFLDKIAVGIYKESRPAKTKAAAPKKEAPKAEEKPEASEKTQE
ncbi:30S ribosomal protein S19e [archaeon]|jgi:small subunit ribosomal protein S19e|nr:30S ribosomal protein S19e [archaeon]MBT6698136.1 30S ribosomal protein S19e [archaeon]